VHAGLESIVRQLLAGGAEIDAVTNDSWTALHESALNGHRGVVRILLEAGAQARCILGLSRGLLRAPF
jgi:ankyrin repeat protein